MRGTHLVRLAHALVGDERRFGVPGKSSGVFDSVAFGGKQREVIEPQPRGLVFAQERKRLARDRSSFFEIALLGQRADEVAERYGKKVVVDDRCLTQTRGRFAEAGDRLCEIAHRPIGIGQVAERIEGVRSAPALRKSASAAS